MLYLHCCADFPLVSVSRGGFSLLCMGFSLWLFLSLWSMDSLASVARGQSSCGSRALEPRFNSVAHGLRISVACGIYPDEGSNLCLLHWQVDSLPLSHQGRPGFLFLDFHLSLEEALFQAPDGGEEMILVLTGAVRQSK